MDETKFRIIRAETDAAGSTACCGTAAGNTLAGAAAAASSRPPSMPRWSVGLHPSPAGLVYRVSTVLTGGDLWEHAKCRISAFRNTFTIMPGLYAVNEPGKDSDIFLSANYKYSFDLLRQSLSGMNAWVLVLDTKGINVWCAAGKGTFGTSELIRSIRAAQLEKVVAHNRRVIAPQLGGVGVSAYQVARQTGFRVHFGPVYARDIQAFVSAGYRATQEMRQVRFNMKDRLVLTPMEINPAMKKFPLYSLIVLLAFGLQPSGIIFGSAFEGGVPFLLLGLLAVFSGAFLTPVFLPYVPFRSFAVKGWIMGAAFTILALQASGLFSGEWLLRSIACIFFPVAASYIALQFTGSTTFTGMSGVKRELRVAIPLYLLGLAVSAVLLVIFKAREWGVL